MKKISQFFVAHLGMQTILLAEFRVISGRSLVLNSLIQEKITPISSLGEFDYEKFKNILYTWRKKEKIKEREKLTISFPSQLLFTRFLKLPEIKDIRSTIAFEAQQNIPFPLHEVIWDYHIFHSSGNESCKVVLVAGKKVPLLALRNAMREAGFLLARVEIASTALYNAFCFNYPQASGCSLLLNIESNSIHLIFSEKGNFFTRTLPKMTLSLRNEDSFFNEQMSKKPKQLTNKLLTLPESDILIQKIAAEIHRSISFYCDHQGGNSPMRVLLCGPGSEGFQEILKLHLSLPVEFFYPFYHVKISSVKTVKIPIHTLGEIVGLSTHALKNTPIQINLFATELLQELTGNQRKAILITVSLCFIFTLLISWIFLLRITSLKANALTKSKEQISLLAHHAHRLNELKIQSEQLKMDISPVIQAIENRVLWPQLINVLEKSLPSKFIWVTRLEAMNGNKMILPPPSEFSNAKPLLPFENPTDHLLVEGLYLENPQQATLVDDFVHQLSQSPFFHISDKAKVIRIRDTPDGQQWAYPYTLMLPLRISYK